VWAGGRRAEAAVGLRRWRRTAVPRAAGEEAALRAAARAGRWRGHLRAAEVAKEEFESVCA